MSMILKTMQDHLTHGLLSEILEIDLIDQSSEITYVYFKDRSISPDRFSLISMTKYQYNISDLSLYNNKIGNDSRFFTVVLRKGLDGSHTGGELIMNDDYTLSIDTCKKLYGSNITISYY